MKLSELIINLIEKMADDGDYVLTDSTFITISNGEVNINQHMNAVDYWYQKYLKEKAERENFIDKAVNRLEEYLVKETIVVGNGPVTINFRRVIDNFKKAMERNDYGRL